MLKFFALFTFSLAFFFNFYSKDSISKSFSAIVTMATPTPVAPNNLFRMELDRDTFTIPCPPGYRCLQSDADSAPIVVTVSNSKSKDIPLRYKYKATGGRVIGEGSKVSWDLDVRQLGTYTITVAIQDEAGNELQTITKEITVQSYIDDGDRCLAACPELSISAPMFPVQAGETMTFTANASGGVADKITYNWTISAGKIIEGQGTPVIRVATNTKMAGKTVEAVAEFRWDSECWEICNKTASASGSVIAKKRKKN